MEDGGVEVLLDKNRRKPNFKNRVDEAAERAVCDWAIASPAHGQARTSNELRKAGVFVSSPPQQAGQGVGKSIKTKSSCSTYPVTARS